MALVGLAYSLTMRVGHSVANKIRHINYRDGTTFPAESIFRKGLSTLTPYCGKIEYFLDRWIRLDSRQSHALVKNVE